MPKYHISVWNKGKQDYDLVNRETTLTKARAWAKRESKIMDQTYRVEKVQEMGTFTKGKMK